MCDSAVQPVLLRRFDAGGGDPAHPCRAAAAPAAAERGRGGVTRQSRVNLGLHQTEGSQTEELHQHRTRQSSHKHALQYM